MELDPEKLAKKSVSTEGGEAKEAKRRIIRSD